MSAKERLQINLSHANAVLNYPGTMFQRSLNDPRKVMKNYPELTFADLLSPISSVGMVGFAYIQYLIDALCESFETENNNLYTK
jgi:hypothetical protein